MIYVIRAESELVKIGYTKNSDSFKKRLKSLATGCPNKIKVEATMPGSKLKERCIHGFCVKRHVRGEWFRLSRDEVCRMVAKYQGWSPSSDNIKNAPEIRHFKRGAKIKFKS